jgi:hypothetical protein
VRPMLRTALGALLAVLALGAVASSSASAEACKQKAGSKKWALCVEGGKVASSRFESKNKPETSGIFSFGGATKITCSEVTAPGELSENASHIVGIHKLRLKFKHCAAGGNLQGCEVQQQTIGFEPSEGKLGPAVEDVKVRPEGALEEFGRWNIVNAPGKLCGWTGQTHWFPSETPPGPECTLKEAGVEQLAHKIVCESAAVKVEADLAGLDENKTYMTVTQLVELSETLKGKKFSIYES